MTPYHPRPTSYGGVMLCSAAKATPSPHGASGRSKSPDSGRADLGTHQGRQHTSSQGGHPAAAGPLMTNERGLRSTSCRGGSTAAVLGTAGCPRSSMTSPLLAILGYCPASEAGRKIASSTAASFSTASPLFLAWVANVTGQVTQNANISR